MTLFLTIAPCFRCQEMLLLAMGAFIDRWTDGWMDGWMCRRVDCRPNTTRRRDGWIDAWMDEWMHRCTYRTREAKRTRKVLPPLEA